MDTSLFVYDDCGIIDTTEINDYLMQTYAEESLLNLQIANRSKFLEIAKEGFGDGGGALGWIGNQFTKTKDAITDTIEDHGGVHKIVVGCGIGAAMVCLKGVFADAMQSAITAIRSGDKDDIEELCQKQIPEARETLNRELEKAKEAKPDPNMSGKEAEKKSLGFLSTLKEGVTELAKVFDNSKDSIQKDQQATILSNLGKLLIMIITSPFKLLNAFISTKKEDSKDDKETK